MNQEIRQAIMDRLQEGQLPCAAAHAIAQEYAVDPLPVGLAAEDAGIRISRCQLGLFGYGPKAEGKHKIVRAMDPVPELLAARLRDLAHGGTIACLHVWEVAVEFELSRLEASGAAEALEQRVSPCQLGCF